MTPTEAAELQKLGLTPDDLKAKQQALASVTAPQTANNAVRLTNLGKCPKCGADSVFHDRNRIANCGHVRRSHGKLVPVEAGKPKGKAADGTTATHQEIIEGIDVATELAARLKQVPNPAVRQMIRKLLNICCLD